VRNRGWPATTPPVLLALVGALLFAVLASRVYVLWILFGICMTALGLATWLDFAQIATRLSRATVGGLSPFTRGRGRGMVRAGGVVVILVGVVLVVGGIQALSR
jgi:hypothetical protein